MLTATAWRAVSALFGLLLRIPAAMVPDGPLPTGMEYVGVGKEFYVNSGGAQITAPHAPWQATA